MYKTKMFMLLRGILLEMHLVFALVLFAICPDRSINTINQLLSD